MERLVQTAVRNRIPDSYVSLLPRDEQLHAATIRTTILRLYTQRSDHKRGSVAIATITNEGKLEFV